jgi:small-conductance mechanosensitive channel
LFFSHGLGAIIDRRSLFRVKPDITVRLADPLARCLDRDARELILIALKRCWVRSVRYAGEEPYRLPVSLLVRIALPLVVFACFLLGMLVCAIIPVAILLAIGIETVTVLAIVSFLGLCVGIFLGMFVGRWVASRLFGIDESDVDGLMPD